MNQKRECGVLLPVSSLPSKYGIGCFSKSAYDFVDALKEAGQSCWQILPLGPTSYGDSPYQSFSTFAGNPYFISLEDLIEEGVLTKKECDRADFGKNRTSIDYAKIYKDVYKRQVLSSVYPLRNFPEKSFSLERSPFYWAGWALAEYQWSTGKRFKDIFSRISLSEIISMYSVYHEMDIEHFIEDMNIKYNSVNRETDVYKRQV